MAGIGVYVYGMFSIMGSIFALQDDKPGNKWKPKEIMQFYSKNYFAI